MMRMGVWAGAVLVAMAVGAVAQTSVGATGQGATETLVVEDPGMGTSRVIAFEGMPVRAMANGGESRDALKGKLPNGMAVAVHESTMRPGTPANPVHAVEHAEVITVIEGVLEFLHDGKAELVGKGGVIYVAPGSRHTMRVSGTGVVRYVVVQVGGDAGA